jgi:hypothetical protein
MIKWLKNRKQANIVGMIYYGKQKTHHLNISGKHFSFFKLGLFFLISFLIISTVAASLLFLEQEKQQLQISKLKRIILKYQIKHEDIFSQVYSSPVTPTSATQKPTSTKADSNKISKADFSKISIDESFENKFLELSQTKTTELKIQNLSYELKDGQLSLSCTITNLSKEKIKEGYLWGLVAIKHKKNSQIKIISFPKNIEINNTSLEPKYITEAHHYKIKNYLTKKYIQSINTTEDWIIYKTLILAKDTDKKITGFYFDKNPDYNKSS